MMDTTRFLALCNAQDYSRKLVRAADMMETDLDAGLDLYWTTRGMEECRRMLNTVATSDYIERKQLRKLGQEFGQDAVDEIIAEALLRLCTPLSPLLGMQFSNWMMSPADGYKIAKTALNSTRKTWTNRRRRALAEMGRDLGDLISSRDNVERNIEVMQAAVRTYGAAVDPQKVEWLQGKLAEPLARPAKPTKPCPNSDDVDAPLVGIDLAIARESRPIVWGKPRKRQRKELVDPDVQAAIDAIDRRKADIAAGKQT